MEDKMITEFTLEDGRKYLVMFQQEYEGHLYLYLVNDEDGEDVLIQEYKNDELLGVSDEIFDKMMELFQNRFKN